MGTPLETAGFQDEAAVVILGKTLRALNTSQKQLQMEKDGMGESPSDLEPARIRDHLDVESEGGRGSLG